MNFLQAAIPAHGINVQNDKKEKCSDDHQIGNSSSFIHDAPEQYNYENGRKADNHYSRSKEDYENSKIQAQNAHSNSDIFGLIAMQLMQQNGYTKCDIKGKVRRMDVDAV